MESPHSPEKQPRLSRIRLVGQILGRVVRESSEQLRTADLNPHEGRLRGSQIPEGYIRIPDFPPESDNPDQK